MKGRRSRASPRINLRGYLMLIPLEVVETRSSGEGHMVSSFVW